MSKCQQAVILTPITHNILQYSGHTVETAAVFTWNFVLLVLLLRTAEYSLIISLFIVKAS